ncbi:L,D-transpeptidase [Pseudonocardiaceae bacterium YIM PH 21723]|nr:L,D-transpeptidase [Pseudonocardiaceae bacterium YIM PH 21723]
MRRLLYENTAFGGDMKTRRTIAAIALVVLAGVITGCSTGGGSLAGAGPVAEQQALVTADPADGTQDVNPAAPVTLRTGIGQITEVQFSKPDGGRLDGVLSEDKTSWKLGVDLGFGKTYSWTAKAKNDKGTVTESKGSLTTLAPGRTVQARMDMGDGGTYGVGQTFGIKFPSPVQDKAAVQKRLTVTATPAPVEGSWAWVSDTEVRYRPAAYWPANTHVHVAAKLYAAPVAPGAYGANDLTLDFDIGRSRIMRGNTQTHRFLVEDNGVQTADYPASYGAENDPGKVTPNGNYVIMSKHETERMKNDKYNYDVMVNKAMRFSSNGEYTHAYSQNPNIGRSNSSHGCVNLRDADAAALFGSSLVGDPVIITGSSVEMPAYATNRDWQLPYAQWKAKSAL